MKINELIEQRSNITSQIDTLLKGELTEEVRTQIANLEANYEQLGKDIDVAKRQAERSKSVDNPIAKKEDKRTLGVEFRDFLKEAVENNGKREFRVDPMLASSNTNVINKTVANSVDILASPGEAFLRSLGVTFYPGLTGNFVVPSMAEDTATFPGEAVAGADASMNMEALVLAARRVSHSQTITKETLAQTNPAIYNGILQNLYNGIWNAITYDVFDTIDSDAATQKKLVNEATLSFGSLVNMEASIGGLNIGQGSYVTTPSVKAYLKKTAALTNQAAIWNNNEVNGYPAYGVPAANAKEVYFGDFSRAAVGTWGDIEYIVDPLTKAKEGEIVITAIALVDSGVTNKRAFCILTDVSLS